MNITVWGCRGSIPVSGSQYVKYGGDTTCLELRTKNDEIIIIDAGSGIRALGNKLLSEDRHRYSLVFTHAHWDHIMGIPFFKPLYFEGNHIDVYGCPFTQDSVKEMISNAMAPPRFPVKFEDLKAETVFHGACKGSFTLDTVRVETTRLSHPNQGVGYKFVEDGQSFVFLTDNELTFRHPGGLDFSNYLDFAANADLLIHDAEYTREEYRETRTWGHSVYNDALRLAMEAGAKSFGLFHHNQDRIDIALDNIVQDCRQSIQRSGSPLECFAVRQGMEIRPGR